MLNMQDLHSFDAVAIQCHDNPDADAMAGAFALGRYFELRGVPVTLFYGGVRPVSKPNLLLLLDALRIPLHFAGREAAHIDDILNAGTRKLLVTVDCQHGAGNVQRIGGASVCVIDHHIKEKDEADLEHIEPYLGSCSTVVWKLLAAAGFDFTAHPDVSTALYYGLFTDTNSFAELFHPVDRDMLDALRFDARLIRKLKGSNLSRDELLIAGKALHGAQYDEAHGTAVYEADPCDPNILGFISDLTLQVENVGVTVGFSDLGHGIKLSLRSSTDEVMANELAAYLTEGVGSGGGNREKAGGFLKLPESRECGAEYLTRKLREYFASYDTLVAGEYVPDITSMRRYRKRDIPVGYVRLTDMYPEGTEVIVRTLEGDAAFAVDAHTLLMIGIQGEAYPISREKFENSYVPQQGSFSFPETLMTDRFYSPTVMDKIYRKSSALLPHTRPCRSSGEIFIYARPMERPTKVFTPWYEDGYMRGKPGDYLAVRGDDTSDVYIIDAEVFGLSYEEIDGVEAARLADGGNFKCP